MDRRRDRRDRLASLTRPPRHEIPLGARIVSVCDAYCAMRQRRPYGEVLDEEEALDELRRGAGSQFDPALVAAFCVLRGSGGGSGRFIRAARLQGQAERAPAAVDAIEAA